LTKNPIIFKSVAKISAEVKTIFYHQKRSGLIKDVGLGLIHLYHGLGKGKTTSAVGLAIRAAGCNFQVDFTQFMKSGNSSEVAIFKQISNIRYWCPGKHPFIMTRGPLPEHFEHAAKALSFAFEAIERGTHLLVCDEILDALIFNVLEKDQLLDLMKTCKNKVELVMTGINAPPEIVALADYVTELVQEKHPYYSGMRARKGIEY
jgi:cob(I)alamin adenosyltransferase